MINLMRLSLARKRLKHGQQPLNINQSRAGDTLIFVCGKDIIIKHVTKVEHFNSLNEMFSKLPLASILPSAQDKNDAMKIYFSFPGYKEKIEAEGILAFSFIF